jgi:hypothetical protein
VEGATACTLGLELVRCGAELGTEASDLVVEGGELAVGWDLRVEVGLGCKSFRRVSLCGRETCTEALVLSFGCLLLLLESAGVLCGTVETFEHASRLSA